MLHYAALHLPIFYILFVDLLCNEMTCVDIGVSFCYQDGHWGILLRGEQRRRSLPELQKCKNGSP